MVVSKKPGKTFARAKKALSAVEKELKSVGKVSAPSMALWMLKNKHRLGEFVTKATTVNEKVDRHSSEKGRSYMSKLQERLSKKNSNSSKIPHVKVQIPNEILESDFTPGIFHQQSDVNRPVEIKIKRTVGKLSSSMKSCIEMFQKQTFNLSDDELPGTMANLLKRVYSTCGFNRCGLFWPWWYMESILDTPTTANSRVDCRASQDFGTCTGPQYLRFFTNLNTQGSRKAHDAILWPMSIPEGDQDFLFPIRESKKVYSIMNMNTVLPAYLSIMICAPKGDTFYKNDPLNAWINGSMSGYKPSTGSVGVLESDYAIDKMDYTYSYNFLADQASTPPTTDNDFYTVTSSSEIVREATPFLSSKFKNKWDVIDVKYIRLQPLQSCHLEIEQIFNNLTSFKRVIPMDIPGTGLESPVDPYKQHPVFFKDMTLIPIIKFWGEECGAYNMDPYSIEPGTSPLVRGITGTGPVLLRTSILKDQFTFYADSKKLRGVNNSTSSAFTYEGGNAGWQVQSRSIRGRFQYESCAWPCINKLGSFQVKPAVWDPLGKQWSEIKPQSFNLLEIKMPTTMMFDEVGPIVVDDTQKDSEPEPYELSKDLIDDIRKFKEKD